MILKELPKLEPDDWLTKSPEFWRDYRETLYAIIKEQEAQKKIDKTPENIVNMALEVGIKPTARYFNITPSTVRYYKNKLNNTEYQSENIRK